MHILLVLLLVLPSLASAEIYRYINENGEVVFADKPVAGAQKQNVPSPTTVPGFKVPKSAGTTDTEQTDTTQTPEFTRYQKLEILQPPHDTQVRSNAGVVDIAVKAVPELVTNRGHRFQINLDGKRLQTSWATPNFSLPNLDRGTHTIKVLVVDDQDSRILIESQEITFHLFRHSQLFQ